MKTSFYVAFIYWVIGGVKRFGSRLHEAADVNTMVISLSGRF